MCRKDNPRHHEQHHRTNHEGIERGGHLLLDGGGVVYWLTALYIIRSRVMIATLVHFAVGGGADALACLLLDDLDVNLRCLRGEVERCIDASTG